VRGSRPNHFERIGEKNSGGRKRKGKREISTRRKRSEVLIQSKVSWGRPIEGQRVAKMIWGGRGRQRRFWIGVSPQKKKACGENETPSLAKEAG